VPVFNAHKHAIFIRLIYVRHLQRLWQWPQWLSGKTLATLSHVWVRFQFVQKKIFLLLIVLRDLFSLMIILIISCTALC